MKVLILGSMSFSPEIKEIGEQLKEKGHEIRLPEFISDYLECQSREDMHQRAVENKISYNLYETYHKLIKDSDAVLVVNKKKKGIEGYVGANSLIEMAFARALNKRIYLLNQIPNMDYRDEILATQPRILNGDLSKIK